MSINNNILLFITSFIISFFSFKFYIPFLKENNLLDFPINRSAHIKPLPTSGGIIFSTISLIFALVFKINSQDYEINRIIFYSLPLIVLSFLDDFKNIKIRYRLITQIVTSILIISIGNIYFFNLSILGLIIYSFLILVSMTTINMSNFMDGLDGLLAGCMIFIIMGSSIYLNLTSPILFVILGSLFCFFIFNLHPAKIFMGDVGSVFLGCIYSGLLFQSKDINSFFAVLLLATPLYADITITIIRRFFNNENIFLAHKKHLFQRLYQAGWKQNNISNLYILSSIILCFSLLRFGILGEIICSLFILLVGIFLEKKCSTKF